LIKAKNGKSRKQQKKKKDHCIVTYTIQNNNVQKAIDFLLQEIKASRVHIYEFHNGDHFYSGNSQQKFSCTYEALAPGISSESLSLQNLRISTFNSFVHSAVSSEGFNLDDTECVDTLICKNWFDSRGTKSCYAVAIKTLNKNIIGILSVDFNNNNRKISEKERKLLKNQSIIISGYLI